VLKGDALPLHHVHPHGCGVQEHVHQVVVQKIHFIHIEDAPVGRSQKSRLEVLFAAFDGLFEINAAQKAVLGGAEGQIHHGHGPVAHRQGLPPGEALPAMIAHELGHFRVAMEGAARHHGDGGQKRGQPPGRGGFGRAFFAPHQDTAQTGVDGIEDQGFFQQFLAHQGRERVNRSFGGHGHGMERTC
jgi:hypothetical protein